jgi:hypothetical protein
MYSYAVAHLSGKERERFDAILEGRDYDREQRRALMMSMRRAGGA